jgi:hypothetical protein
VNNMILRLILIAYAGLWGLSLLIDRTPAL